ncbi:retrovirus-related pol polyprotein from transposon TNT 1-94 [Tanacetum coccineum]
MGHGTWDYSLGVFLEIIDVFVRWEFEISSWRGARVDVRTYLLGDAIDSSEAKGIIRDPKLELENYRFTFDLVPLSYKSVDVVVGENWLLRHKAEIVCHEKVVKMPCVPKELVGFTPRRRVGFHMELVQGATPICKGSYRLTSLERQEVWNDYKSCKVRVGSNGNLLWEASVLLGRKKGYVMDTLKFTAMPFGLTNAPVVFMELMRGVRVACEDDRGVSEGREDVCEVFQQRGSRAKRKLSRRGRNQMGNEPILALPEGADDFVVYYDTPSKDLEACLEKGEGDCLYVMTTEVLMPRVVKSRDEIFSRWGYCDNHDLSRLDNQSIERDRLIGIGFVLDFVEFISFTFGDKEMISVIEALKDSSFQNIRPRRFLRSGSQSNVGCKKNCQNSKYRIKTRSVFGKKLKHQEALISLIDEGIAISGGFTLTDLYPSSKLLAYLSRLKPKLEKIHHRFDKLLDDIIHKNKAREVGKDEVNIHLLMDALLKVKEHGSLKIPLAMDNIKAIMVDGISAGSDTSSTVVEWAMLEQEVSTCLKRRNSLVTVIVSQNALGGRSTSICDRFATVEEMITSQLQGKLWLYDEVHIVHICVNSLATLTNYAKMEQDYNDEYSENLMIKAELAKKEHMVEKKIFDEVVLRCSRLKNRSANLELKLQHQKESFLNNRSFTNQNAPKIPEFFKINEWQAKLVTKDVSIANLRKHIDNLKGKYVVEKEATKNNAKEIFEHVRALRPLDRYLNSTCMYAQPIQEVLVYDIDTCPSLTKPSEKLIAVTPLNKNKKVSSNLKNKVEDHPRSVKSNSNKKNRVIEPVCNANVKHTTLNANSELINDKCNQCMFDANHDVCFLEFVNDMNVRSKLKSAKRITSTKVEPLKETTSKLVTTPNLEIMIYRWKTKVAKSIDLSNELSIFRSRHSNILEPNKHWGSPALNSPSSSIVNLRSRNYQIAKIMGYGDYQMGKVMISQVYYMERTDNGTELVNQTLRAYYEDVGISHQTSVARTQQQNGVVERRNLTLVEASRTMLIFSKASLFLWAEAVATACFTQN